MKYIKLFNNADESLTYLVNSETVTSGWSTEGNVKGDSFVPHVSRVKGQKGSLLCGLNSVAFENSEGKVVVESFYKGNIPDSNFMGVNATKAVIGGKVKSIGSSGFAQNFSLNEIYIPSSVTEIGEYCFFQCSGLTNAKVENLSSVGQSAFRQCYNLSSVTINGDVEELSESMFRACRSLQSFVTPPNVKTIEGYCFTSCSGMTSFTFNDKLQTIGFQGFGNCQALTSVTLPDSLEYIGSKAFQNCLNLTDLEVGSGLTTLVSDAYEYNTFTDTPLARITVSSDNPKFDSRNNCNCLVETSSNTAVFVGSEAQIPNTVTKLGNGCARGRFGLVTLNIPDSVTYIGRASFEYCENLTGVTIGTGITTIMTYAFYGCGNQFVSLTIKATTPPNLQNSDCLNSNANLQIYVPSSAVNTYKTSAVWSAFASRIQAMPT